jgi:glycerate 2-kinase
MHKNDILKSVMNSALKAAMPKDKFKTLPKKPKGKLLVIGAGKAAASMAKEFEESYNGPIEGIVITRYGHATKTKFIEVVEASHPEPDKIGLLASKKLFSLAKKADINDHVVFLISGGASSLLTLPADGINFEEKQRINKELLISGAPIDQMNIVRRALSKIKGGRLAEAIHPAKLTTYMISDIPGDDPSYIGSGPTIQASGSNNDAFKILNDYKIDISENLKEIIIKNQLPKILNSPTYMLANPMMALKSAYNEAEKLGFKPV